MLAALDGSHPEGVFAGLKRKEFFGAFEGFRHRFLRPLFGHVPARGNVENSGYVAADAFLVINDFLLRNFNVAVNEDLVGA